MSHSLQKRLRSLVALLRDYGSLLYDSLLPLLFTDIRSNDLLCPAVIWPSPHHCGEVTQSLLHEVENPTIRDCLSVYLVSGDLLPSRSDYCYLELSVQARPPNNLSLLVGWCSWIEPTLPNPRQLPQQVNAARVLYFTHWATSLIRVILTFGLVPAAGSGLPICLGTGLLVLHRTPV